MPPGRPARHVHKPRTNESEDKNKLDDKQQTLIDIANWPLPALTAVPLNIHVKSEVPTSPDSQFRLVVTTVKPTSY